MKKYFLQTQTFSLLTIFIFITVCNGQTKTNASKATIDNQSTNKKQTTKLIMTQGSNLADNVHCGLQDKAGNIWFCTTGGGVYKYDGKTFTNFIDKVGIGNSILSDKVGNIWFTGEEGNNSYESKEGIWRYDGKTFTNFSTKDGMGKYFVHFMLEDKNGNIWIGTRNTGLYKYDGKNFTNFSE
jgi:ligand-binding sensor domain-containing protein